MAEDSDLLLHDDDERGIGRRQLLKGASLLAGAGAALVPEALSAQTLPGGGRPAEAIGHRAIQNGWPPYPTTPVKKETIERFKEHAVQDLWSVCKDLGLNSWTGVVRPIAPGMKLCGRAVTMRLIPIQNTKDRFTLGSKDFEHTASMLTWMSQAGDILVFDAGGYMEGAPVGGNVAAMAQHFGAGGIIIDGANRDTNQIMQLEGFAVFARGTVAPASHGFHRTANLNNEPVQVGTISIAPGDIVVGDMDGIVVIPADRAEEIIVKADELRAFEAEMFSRYKRGEAMHRRGSTEPIAHHADSMRSVDPSLIQHVPKGLADPRKK